MHGSGKNYSPRFMIYADSRKKVCRLRFKKSQQSQ